MKLKDILEGSFKKQFMEKTIKCNHCGISYPLKDMAKESGKFSNGEKLICKRCWEKINE